MRCERVQFLYDEYSQGSLTVSTLGRVEEHLAGCPACRQFYEESDAISGLIRESSEIAHPGADYFAGLHDRVLAALDRPETERPTNPAQIIEMPATQWRRPLWWVGATAAAALLAVATLPALLTQPEMAWNPPSSIAVPTQTAALPVPGGTRQGVDSLNPGTRNPTSIENIITTLPHYGERDEVGPDERKATEETKARMASVRRQAEEDGALPPEVFKQLQVLKTQVIDGGNEDLSRSLRELENLVDPRIPDQVKLSSIPLVKQANYYLNAADDLRAGRYQDAISKYRKILFFDEPLGELSPISIKASLQMADLYYDTMGTFSEARIHYKRCLEAKDKSVLNSTELKKIDSRLERLERYQENNFAALEQLHKVFYGKWDEVLAALRGLTAQPATGALLPDAAQAMLARMETTEDPPPSAIVMDLYNLLAKQAEVEQNVDVRAWLWLALGDIESTQFQDIRKAVEHYDAAKKVKSEAAVQARLRLAQMDELKWDELVRIKK